MNHGAMIETIVDQYQEYLNDWELEFIAKVYQWHVLDNKPLSKRQKDVIVKINGKMADRS